VLENNNQKERDSLQSNTEKEIEQLTSDLNELQNSYMLRNHELAEAQEAIKKKERDMEDVDMQTRKASEEMERKLSSLQQDIQQRLHQIQALSSTVTHSSRLVEVTADHFQSLHAQIDALRNDLSVKEMDIREINANYHEIEKQLKNADETIHHLRHESDRSNDEFHRLNDVIKSLESRLAITEEELVRKNHQLYEKTELANSLEDDAKVKDNKLQVLEAHLQKIRHEYALMREHSTSKLLMSNKSSSIGGLFSRKPPLEAYREASMAHQTHNAFLNLEIRRLETEKTSQEKIYLETITRIKSELTVRNQLYNSLISEQIGTEADAIIKELNVNLEVLKKKYFISLAVGSKLQHCLAGLRCNVDAYELYERLTSQHITEVEQWPTWIAQELAKETR